MFQQIGSRRQSRERQTSTTSSLGVPARSESPHPDAESAGDDKCYYTHPHRSVVSSDNHSGMIDQSHDVAERKERENYARDAQSSCLGVHARILPVVVRLVSKN